MHAAKLKARDIFPWVGPVSGGRGVPALMFTTAVILKKYVHGAFPSLMITTAVILKKHVPVLRSIWIHIWYGIIQRINQKEQTPRDYLITPPCCFLLSMVSGGIYNLPGECANTWRGSACGGRPSSARSCTHTSLPCRAEEEAKNDKHKYIQQQKRERRNCRKTLLTGFGGGGG